MTPPTSRLGKNFFGRNSQRERGHPGLRGGPTRTRRNTGKKKGAKKEGRRRRREGSGGVFRGYDGDDVRGSGPGGGRTAGDFGGRRGVCEKGGEN